MNRPVQNLRRADRRPTRLPAVLAFPWGELEGTIENIAEGGAFFVTGTLEGEAVVGDRLTVAFTNDSGRRRELPGEILRVERYFHAGDLYRALAVKFDRPYRPEDTGA